MTHVRPSLSPRVRLIGIITAAIIGVLAVVVVASFAIGNKLAPAAAPFCELESDSQKVIVTVTGPDCRPTVQWIADHAPARSLTTWITTTLPLTGVLIAEDVRGPDILRLYAAQQPDSIRASLLLASGLAGAGWLPSGPSVTPAPSPAA
jgi:hypothetical protein